MRYYNTFFIENCIILLYIGLTRDVHALFFFILHDSYGTQSVCKIQVLALEHTQSYKKPLKQRKLNIMKKYINIFTVFENTGWALELQL